MDENRRAYSFKAPGPDGSGSAMRLPGRGSFPNVDDHLVEPEVTRDEIIGGRRMEAFPAEAPHADQQTELDYVLRAHVASGYRASTDLITRYGVDSDFASDTCVRREGTDPATGRRHLEEIAFEIVSKQSEKLATEKAERMHRRGVRRIFAVWVKNGEVGEWSPEERTWRRLEVGANIEDHCLATPLKVAALLDAAIADNAVAEALVAKGNPVILKREASAKAAGKVEGREEGRADGVARSILEVLAAREVEASEAQQEKILGCQDREQLGRWLRRAAVASSATEVLAEP
ncbi:MAG: hypothetical protein ABJC13_05410 [Acidobacteriota bacterium]